MWLQGVIEDQFYQDVAACVISLSTCVIWLKSIDALVDQRVLENKLSRKVIHIGTGPLFMLTWNFFSASKWAPVAAAVVPGVITFNFLLLGLGILKDPGAVAALTRRGDPREILRGPLLYGLSFILLTVTFWRHSPSGILALTILCLGDGLADIIGRRFGRARLPFSRFKTWVGSGAMFVGSFAGGLGFLKLMDSFGNFKHGLILGQTALVCGLEAAAATLAEAITPGEMDNLSILVACLSVGALCQSVLGWGS